MNLTIPIMDGQIAHITVVDGKTAVTHMYIADHRQVQVFDKDEKGGVYVKKLYATDVDPDQDIVIKGVGRNKRKSRTYVNLKDL